MLSHQLAIKEVLENPRSIFNVLTASEKEEFQFHVTLTNYKRNDYIFREGTRPNGLLYLIEGKAKIFKEGVGGREQIIRMSKPHSLIGFRALLANEMHIASAVTLEESVVAYINAEFFQHHLLKNTDFSSRLLRVIAQELGFSNLRMVNLTQKHIRGRLAESILLLKDKYGYESDGTTLKVYISREDIANLSNMTTSNAIRTLSTFAGEKIIAIDGRKIRLLDVHRLELVSKLG